VPTVSKALERYTNPERLDSDNAYNCAAYVLNLSSIWLINV